MTQTLSESRLNRRLHNLPFELWQTLFGLLSEVFKQCNPTNDYIVDSMPIPACDNIRIRRCRLLGAPHSSEEEAPEKEAPEKEAPEKEAPEKEANRGRIASERRYSFGLRVHWVVTGRGKPVEFVLASGREADVEFFKWLNLGLPAGSTLHADKGYTDYQEEDLLEESGEIQLLSARKRNAMRKRAP